jgi:hypothetical protein
MCSVCAPRNELKCFHCAYFQNNFYESLDALVAEMNQCFQNAKIYNETESMLYQVEMLIILTI